MAARVEARLRLAGFREKRLKKLIARLLEAYAEEAGVDLQGYGGATFRKEAAQRGLEPDECYSIGKIREVPDVAIEVVITSGLVDKLAVYHGLGVGEVWVWGGRSRPGPQRRYRTHPWALQARMARSRVALAPRNWL